MNSASRYIAGLLKKKDLSEFVESEAGVSLSRSGNRFTCVCPMPFHKDSKPSFGIHEASSGVWLYHCFGCGSGGTIIDFCIDYHGLASFDEAVRYLMKKFNVETNAELVTQALNETKVTIDSIREMECQHIQAATACRILLRQNPADKSVQEWVLKAYMGMNAALSSMDTPAIERVKSDAVDLMTGKADAASLRDGCIMTKEESRHEQ